jgi:hypothetical protein
MPAQQYQRQGTLDGMCGHYAIVNALTECGVVQSECDQIAIFKCAYGVLPKEAIYKGAYFPGMKKILKKIPHSKGLSKRWRRICISYPFKKNGFKANQYIGKLRSLLRQDSVHCAIICVQRADDDWDDHWIVVKGSGGRLEFIDSVNQKGSDTISKNPSSLGVGRYVKGSSDNRWRLVNRRQVILFLNAFETFPPKQKALRKTARLLI